MGRSREAVEAEMEEVGARLQELSEELPRLYARREELLVEGRTVSPPIEHAVAGAYFGLDDKGAMKVLRERRKRLGLPPGRSRAHAQAS